MFNVADRLLESGVFWRSLRRTGNLLVKTGFNPRPPAMQTVRYTLHSQDWPQSYGPLKIALASDFHVGSTHMPLERFEQVVENLNALEADIILLPGDFLNSPHGADGGYVPPTDIASRLQTLQAPLGVYSVLGNHDIYEDPHGMYKALSDVGINDLFNENRVVSREEGSFNLVGVGDATTGNADCKQAFANVAADMPTVALCHNPISVHEMPKIAAAFAGHTHGGQFKLPFWPGKTVGCPDLTLLYGQASSQAGTPVIVTSGLGTSVLPFRNVAPEIVDITLRSPV